MQGGRQAGRQAGAGQYDQTAWERVILGYRSKVCLLLQMSMNASNGRSNVTLLRNAKTHKEDTSAYARKACTR